MAPSGFKALKLRLSNVSDVDHYLYIKQNVVRLVCKEKPCDRTLFVVGLMPYLTEACVKNIFQQFGPVSKIYLQDQPSIEIPKRKNPKFFDNVNLPGYKVAYVVFKSPDTLMKALKFKKYLILESNSYQPVLGISKWCQEYNERIPNMSDLQKEVDSFMADFDKKCTKERKKQKLSMEADNEGWVTVTRKGRNPGFARKQSVKDKILEKQKKKDRRLLNFYAFEIKESKMNHLEILRKKFEEDKKKIEMLKKARKFRPFN